MEKQKHSVEIDTYFYHNIINFIDDENSKLKDLEAQNGYVNISKYLYQILKLIINLSNNHHRNSNFYNNIDQILLHLKRDIINNFTNLEIFKICKSNKRILLFMIENNIISLNNTILEKLSKIKYKNLGYQSYLSLETDKLPDKNTDNFETYRKNGENESYICAIIRKDEIIDFVSYATRANLKLTSKIQPSIFETNAFLMNKELTLIEYAVFFGSIEIIKYLYLNGVPLTQSLWFYSIH